SMAQRSHEFGARMALGARAQDVARIVMQQGLKLTGVGFALGGMGMYALVKILISLLPPTIRPPPELLSHTKIAITSTLPCCFWDRSDSSRTIFHRGTRRALIRWRRCATSKKEPRFRLREWWIKPPMIGDVVNPNRRYG